TVEQVEPPPQVPQAPHAPLASHVRLCVPLPPPAVTSNASTETHDPPDEALWVPSTSMTSVCEVAARPVAENITAWDWDGWAYVSTCPPWGVPSSVTFAIPDHSSR